MAAIFFFYLFFTATDIRTLFTVSYIARAIKKKSVSTRVESFGWISWILLEA